MPTTKEPQEEFVISGGELVKKVKEILEQGTARRIIIRNEKDETLMEIPLTIGVIGTLLAPYLAAVGALAAVVTNCKIVVVKK